MIAAHSPTARRLKILPRRARPFILAMTTCVCPAPTIPKLLTPTELRKEAREAAIRAASRNVKPNMFKHQIVASKGGWVHRADLKTMAKIREEADVSAGRVRRTLGYKPGDSTGRAERILQADEGIRMRIRDCSQHMAKATAAMQVFCSNNIARALPEACTAELLVHSATLFFMRPTNSSTWAFSSEGAVIDSLQRIVFSGGTIPSFVWLTPVLPHGKTVVLVARDRKQSSPWLAAALCAELDLPSHAHCTR